MLNNELNQDFLENRPKDFANNGNLNEVNDTLSKKVVPCSENVCNSSNGSILDHARSEFWILKIIMERV